MGLEIRLPDSTGSLKSPRNPHVNDYHLCAADSGYSIDPSAAVDEVQNHLSCDFLRNSVTLPGPRRDRLP